MENNKTSETKMFGQCDVKKNDKNIGKSTQKVKSNSKIFFIVSLISLVIFGFIIFNPIKASDTTKKTESKSTGNNRTNTTQEKYTTYEQVDEQNQLNILQVENEELRKKVKTMQTNQDEKMNKIERQLEVVNEQLTAQKVLQTNDQYKSSSIGDRFSQEYQSKVQHFKGNMQSGWQIPEDEYMQLARYEKRQVIPQEQNLQGYEGDNIDGDERIGFRYLIDPGTRIIAITDKSVNSDHPGFFTSKIVRPEVLRNATLICEAGAQVKDRIPVNPTKIIIGDREYRVNGQIEMSYPGLSGKVTKHRLKRMGPAIANAAIGGGFLAWSATSPKGDNINTRELMVKGVLEQSVGGVQNEIQRLGGDFPNTVEVPGGTQFAILLIDKLEINK